LYVLALQAFIPDLGKFIILNHGLEKRVLTAYIDHATGCLIPVETTPGLTYLSPAEYDIRCTGQDVINSRLLI